MDPVDHEQNNQNQDWHKTDARILGQILAVQNAVFALPDTPRIAEFYAQALISMPGITGCRVCLGGTSVRAGEMASSVCAECDTLRGLAGKDDTLIPAISDFRCALADQPDMRVIAIDSYQHHFGFFVIKLENAAVFAAYQPFVGNLSNFVAIILENRLQKDLLQKARNELESRVEERTRDLTVANEALDASRLAALNIMREAIEARQRAEQANSDLQREVIERQRAEQDIALLNFALDNVHEAAFLIDEQARFQFVNEESCRILGYPRAELLELNVSDVDPDFPLERWPSHWQELKTKHSLIFEGRHMAKDGHIFPVEVHANYFKYGGRAYNLALVRDITERKRAEEALQEERKLFIGGPNVAFKWKAAEGWPVEYVSPNILNQFGYTPEELTSGKILYASIVHPNDLLRVAEEVKAYGERKTPFFEQEYRLARADGEYRWVYDFTVVARDSAGVITHYTGHITDITARKQAEQQLLASEQLFRALVENAPDFIARYDREYRRIYVNPAIQKLFKAPVEEVLGKTPANQSPVYAPQTYLSHLRQVIETATESAVEMPFRTAQGEMHWGHMRFVPEFGPDGQVASVLAIGRDIHDIKESERHFRMLAENFPDFVMRFDHEGRYTYVNPAVEKAFGLPSAAIIGQTLQEVPRSSAPEQTAALLALIQCVFAEGAATAAEARWDIVEGERIFEIRFAPEKDATENVVSVLSIARDITERKQAEEALRDSERRLAEAQRIAHVGYWERNFEAGRIILSDEACRIFGLPPQEGPFSLEEWHQRWLTLIHPDDRSRASQAAADAVGNGPPYSIDYRIIRPNGELRFVHSEASVKRDESGRPRYMLGMMQDITARKRAEEELRERERHSQSLLRLARNLERAQTYSEVLDTARDEVKAVIGYQNLWVYLISADKKYARSLMAGGSLEDIVMSEEGTATLIIEGDRMLEEIAAAKEIVVVEDAQTDARTNKEIVARTGNRTIVNVPIVLFDRHLGSVGTGTVGDEGVRVPTPLEQDYLVALASHMAVTLDRIHLLDQRTRTEGELRASEERYRLLHENAGVGIGYYTPAGEIISYNQLAASHMGGKPEDFKGKSIYAIFPKPEADVYMARIQRALAADSPVEYEDHLKLPAGEKWFLSVFSKVCGLQNKVIGIQIISQDITERKRMEEELRSAGLYARSLIEASLDPLVTISPTGKITDVNRATEEATGVPREQLIGDDFSDYFTEPQKAREGYQTVLTAGLVRDFSLTIRHASGETIDVLYNATVYKNQAGELQGVFAAARDITERKRAELERLAHLRFVECMDQVNRAIQSTNDLEQMTSAVLDVVLSIFECDRVGLVYPCEPAATSWRVPMERTRPEYPGIPALGIEIPMDPDVARTFQILRASNSPVKFGAESEYPLPAEVSQRFGFRSFIGMALYPKVDKPWEFVLHQCSYPRVWTSEEERLFQEIGRRLTDALSSLLAYRNLRANETRFRTFVDHATDAFFLHDERGTILDVNRQACESLGYSREELIGMTPYDFDAGTDHAFIDQINPRLDAGEVIVFDTWHRRKDGTVIPVEVRSRPFWQGERRFSVSLARDMTERKRAQEALTLFRTLIDHTNDAIEVVDLKVGRFLDANEQAYHSLGYTREEFLNLTVPEIDPLVTARSMKEILEELQRSGSLTYESQHRRKDGSVFPVEINATYIRLDRDYVLTVARDITERKQAEQALRESEERLRQIASSLREVIWLRDVQTRQVLYVNPAFQELTGRTCESLYEDRDIMMDAIHPDDKEWVIEALDQRFESVPFDKEHRIIRLDGDVRWVWSRIFPVRNEAGEVYRWASIMEDITARKRAEEEIRRLNQELEQRVIDRTAQLEAANKELEAFAYSVSHDLRAPLRHIDGFLELLHKRTVTILDEQSQHYMDTISDATKRMGTLIDDLLSFSRMGRYEMSKMQVDLAELVQEVIRELEPETHGRDIHWRVAKLPKAIGDRALLRLALVNLLSNALKFTQPREQTEIEIGFTREESEAVFFVRDNGVGFDMQYANRLFGVFQRLHHADEFEGTGIGLANVRRIIARHGGRTWAEGEIDHGATFYFSLPHPAQGA